MSAAAGSRIVRAALIGVSGRMGRELLHAATADSGVIIGGAVAAPGSAALGRDAGKLAGLPRLGVAVTADLPAALAGADVALDFSTGAAAPANLSACRAARKPLLLGATGWDARQLEPLLAAAAKDIALLIAANTSLGATLLTELVRLAAWHLPPSFDIDIIEIHHRQKRDSPSGTALALASAARSARAAAGRPGADRAAEIGVASVRAGESVGEHTVLLSGPGEQLSLTHRPAERRVFARGALAAALWLQSRPPGLYTMGDVLGFKTKA